MKTGKVPVVSNYMRNVEFDKTGFEWAHYAKLSAKRTSGICGTYYR